MRGERTEQSLAAQNKEQDRQPQMQRQKEANKSHPPTSAHRRNTAERLRGQQVEVSSRLVERSHALGSTRRVQMTVFAAIWRALREALACMCLACTRHGA